MNVVLWIIAGLLSAMFILAGIMKSTQPKEKLQDKMPWVNDVSTSTLRVIGVTELLAGIGLILPAWTGILPWLTPLAASGLALIMVLAAITHARRKEFPAIVFNAVIFILAVIVAWGRFGPYAL